MRRWWSGAGKVAALGGALVGAAGAGRAVGVASAPPRVVFAAAPPVTTCAVPLREQPLETETDVAPAPKPRPAPVPKVKAPRKIAIAPNGNRAVRTPADEDLPAWVPIRGRLTVVESSDLAENLGLLPIGWAKAHPDEIASVAALLEAERAARAAAAPPPSSGPTTWTYVPGEVFVGL
ncbi:MAG: hypothetical protein KIT84_39245 [Labilithrix sp.]|nr:hypothetical protein [Labilithrix sp.]MCW5817098.1 hypothetical protein [Labilithrix sp.]